MPKINLQEQLSAGLVPFSGLEYKYALEYKGMIPSQQGAIPYPPIYTYEGDSIFPFPQLFYREQTIVAQADTLSFIDSSGVKTPITIYNSGDVGTDVLGGDGAPFDDSSWTKGEGWTITESGKATHNKENVSNLLYTEEDIFTTGKMYLVKMVVSVDTEDLKDGGYLQILTNNTFGEQIRTSGTFYHYFVATAHDTFELKGRNFGGTVDSVVVKEVPEKALTVGGLWSFVDLGNNWALINRNNCVYHVSGLGTFCTDLLGAVCGTSAKDRAILGGITKVPAAYVLLFSTLSFPADTLFILNPTLSAKMVWFSSVGAPELRAMVFPHLYTQDDIWNIFQMNEYLVTPLDWIGEAVDTIPYQTGCVVFGTEGVDFFEVGDFISRSKLSSRGLLNKGAGVASNSRCVYVDKECCLVDLSKEGKQDKRYEGYLSTLTRPVIATYREQYDMFCISGGNKGYVYTGQSLFEGVQSITSILYNEDTEVGCYYPFEDKVFISIPLTFDGRMATIEGVFVQEQELEISVAYAMEKDGPYTYPLYKTVGVNGYKNVGVTGRFFRICIRKMSESYLVRQGLSSIQVGYRLQDTHGRGA